MKISPSQVKKAIVEHALIIKKKQELYEKAKQLNEEAKVLNEMRAFEPGLGPGFVNSGSKAGVGANGMPAQALGLVGSPLSSQPGDSENLNAVGSLKDLYNLDMEMGEEVEQEETCAKEKISQLEKEVEDLKAKLSSVSDALQGLNQ